MIEGNYKGQYARIYEYLLELRTRNPGTTTICHLDSRLFQRLYVCLQACKNGFMAGCRRIVSVDDCYLTVESENSSSWSWCLDILKTDLGINDSCNICFMNDKEKGLVDVVDHIFPNANVINCVRHIYNNFKELHKGKALKDAVWKAARATYMQEFEEAMKQLKALSVPAYNWLHKLNPD
ncbi:hypothetical protein V6N13_059725 [Hibiscus sabdariffa]